MGVLSYNIVYHFSSQNDLKNLTYEPDEEMEAALALCAVSRTKNAGKKYIILLVCEDERKCKSINTFISQIDKEIPTKVVTTSNMRTSISAPKVVIAPSRIKTQIKGVNCVILNTIDGAKLVAPTIKLGLDSDKCVTVVICRHGSDINEVTNEVVDLTKEVIKIGKKDHPRLEGDILYAAGDNKVSVQTTDPTIREIDRTRFLLRVMGKVKTRETVFNVAVEYVSRHSNADELLEGALGGPVKYLFLTGKISPNKYKWVMADEGETPTDTWKSNLALASKSIDENEDISPHMLSWLKYQLHSREDCRDFMSCPELRAIWDDFMTCHIGGGSIFASQKKSFKITMDKCKKVIDNKIDKNNEEIDEITGLDAWLTKQYYNYRDRRGVMTDKAQRTEWENWFGDGDRVLTSVKTQFFES